MLRANFALLNNDQSNRDRQKQRFGFVGMSLHSFAECCCMLQLSTRALLIALLSANQ
jgi:hypothetical protein